jgi:hypothetical protein
MGDAHNFIGNVDNAIEHYQLAEQFSPDRNEHLMHLCFYFEKLNRIEEALTVVNKMLQPERVNPFPRLSFLIEGRAYHNTGTMLSDLKVKFLQKINEPMVDMTSITFDFK